MSDIPKKSNAKHVKTILKDIMTLPVEEARDCIHSSTKIAPCSSKDFLYMIRGMEPKKAKKIVRAVIKYSLNEEPKPKKQKPQVLPQLTKISPEVNYKSDSASTLINEGLDIIIEEVKKEKEISQSILQAVSKKEDVKSVLNLLKKFKRKGMLIDNLLQSLEKESIVNDTCNAYKEVKSVINSECDKTYVQNKDECIERTFKKANVDQTKLKDILANLGC